MKTYQLIISLLLGLVLNAKAQNPLDYFITVWDLSIEGSGATQLRFEVLTIGTVNYTWETIPAGSTGSGTFSGNNTLTTITGLPSSSKIRLKIAPVNFKAIKIIGGDRIRLIDVEQWGTVSWSNFYAAFWGCRNLDISATDLPNLSGVTDMSNMFRDCSKLNSPNNIGNWNTSNVTNMSTIFSGATNFNQDIRNWNTEKVINMHGMFGGAVSFIQDIGNWNTSNVTNMSRMFSSATNFNRDIGNWNTVSVTDMSYMFSSASNYNQYIGDWNTKNVTDMQGMFRDATSFNQDIGNWNTVSVMDMSNMFHRASNYNQHIGDWNTENVTDMQGMFRDATSFNQPIGNWNTANITNMSGIFLRATYFNQDIGNWNTMSVTDMSYMFSSASNYNQYIGDWNTENVTNMSYMFDGAVNYNQDISKWNTANVTNMTAMFFNTTNFNQYIGDWNTENVTNMSYMFSGASNFNQSIGDWALHSNVNLIDILNNSDMDCANYSATLIGWANNPSTPNNRFLGAIDRMYGINAQSAREDLIAKGWIIYGDIILNETCLPCQTPEIISWSVTEEAVAGSRKRLSVTYSGSEPTFSWFKNNSLINGASLDSLAFAPIWVSDQGFYQVRLINGCGEVLSDSVYLAVNPKPISINGLVASSKVYDGNTSAIVSGGSLSGVHTSHISNVTFSTSGTFNNKNVGTNKPIAINANLSGTEALNYTLNPVSNLVANITPRNLEVSGTWVTQNKVYDGNTNAVVENIHFTFLGLIASDVVVLDSVSASFENIYIGNDKTVYIDSLYLSGVDYLNYFYIRTELPTTTANIISTCEKEGYTSSSTDVVSACNSYTWIDGNTYTSNNNTATYTLTNKAGCDSVITLDLTINKVNDNSITLNNNVLTANNSNATYQWGSCDGKFTIINGEINQSFVVEKSGSYVVEIRENGCTTYSECKEVTIVSYCNPLDMDVYPNPTDHAVTFYGTCQSPPFQVKVFNSLGQFVFERELKGVFPTVNFPDGSGFYLLEVEWDKQSEIHKVVKF